jgi:hypothetical protein
MITTQKSNFFMISIFVSKTSYYQSFSIYFFKKKRSVYILIFFEISI